MSLFGYFWLFNALNILDGALTLWGIELGLFQETNPALVFYIERFGLYQTIFAMKFLGLALSLLAYLKGSRTGLVLVSIPYCLMVLYQICGLTQWFLLTAANN